MLHYVWYVRCVTFGTFLAIHYVKFGTFLAIHYVKFGTFLVVYYVIHIHIFVLAVTRNSNPLNYAPILRKIFTHTHTYTLLDQAVPRAIARRASISMICCHLWGVSVVSMWLAASNRANVSHRWRVSWVTFWSFCTA